MLNFASSAVSALMGTVHTHFQIYLPMFRFANHYRLIVSVSVMLAITLSAVAQDFLRVAFTLPLFEYSAVGDDIKGKVKSVSTFRGEVKRYFGNETLERGGEIDGSVFYDENGRRRIKEYGGHHAWQYKYDNEGRISEVVYWVKSLSSGKYKPTPNKATFDWIGTDSIVVQIYQEGYSGPVKQVGYRYGENWVRSTAYDSPEAYAQVGEIRLQDDEWVWGRCFSMVQFSDGGYVSFMPIVSSEGGEGIEYTYDNHGNWIIADNGDEDGIFIREITYYDDATAEATKIKEPVLPGADDNGDEIYVAVEQQPQFPGGEGAMYKWVSQNMRYPATAQENGVQGRVTVRFCVEKDGSISNVKVIRSVDEALDKEAIRVVRTMPRWIPGRNNGQPVRTYYTIPITFRLP